MQRTVWCVLECMVKKEPSHVEDSIREVLGEGLFSKSVEGMVGIVHFRSLLVILELIQTNVNLLLFS